MRKLIIVLMFVLIALMLISQFSTRELKTEIEINASAEDVWSILINFEDYPNWNPFITKISGEAVKGNSLNTTITQEGQDEMNFEPELLVVDDNRELRWIGKLILPRLFDGEHYFIIEKISDEKIKFMQGENFKGLLVLPIWSLIEDQTRNGFIAMNEALKVKAESIAQPKMEDALD